MLHIACDVHTHTIASRHAYSTIEENVRAAAEQRIELIGSTDHFSRMVATPHDGAYDLRDYQHFINCDCWPRTWCGLRVLHGCEADIVDLDGNLFGYDQKLVEAIDGTPYEKPRTLADRVLSSCDYAIASVHESEFAKGATPAEVTRMYVRALDNPHVLALGHIVRSGLEFDLDEVLLAARERGKLIEINESTLRDTPRAAAGCERLARRCAELGVMVSTGTDAHVSAAVGTFSRTRELLEAVSFPQALVATADADVFLDVMRRAVG